MCFDIPITLFSIEHIALFNHGVNTQFLGERSGDGVALLNPLTVQKADFGVCCEKGVP